MIDQIGRSFVEFTEKGLRLVFEDPAQLDLGGRQLFHGDGGFPGIPIPENGAGMVDKLSKDLAMAEAGLKECRRIRQLALAKNKRDVAKANAHRFRAATIAATFAAIGGESEGDGDSVGDSVGDSLGEAPSSPDSPPNKRKKLETESDESDEDSHN